MKRSPVIKVGYWLWAAPALLAATLQRGVWWMLAVLVGSFVVVVLAHWWRARRDDQEKRILMQSVRRVNTSKWLPSGQDGMFDEVVYDQPQPYTLNS